MILQAGFLFRVFGNESISPPVLSMSFQLPVWFVYVLLVSWKVTSTWLIFLGRFVPPKKRGTKMMVFWPTLEFFCSHHTCTQKVLVQRTHLLRSDLKFWKCLRCFFAHEITAKFCLLFLGLQTQILIIDPEERVIEQKQPTTFLCEAEAREKVDSFSTLSHGLLPFFTSKSFRMRLFFLNPQLFLSHRQVFPHVGSFRLRKKTDTSF